MRRLKLGQPYGIYSIVIISLLSFLISPLAFTQDAKENAEFKLAVGLYNDGMYDLAVEQFKNFINAYPSTSQGIEARLYLGQTQLKLKRYDDARITFQNFALTYVDHPKAPEAWVRVGEAFLGVNNEREAASALERVKVFHPKSPLVPEALFKAGEIFRRLGDRENAKKNFRTIIQEYPSSTSVLSSRLAIGEMFAEEGQTELAEREARRVSESDAPPAVKGSALFSLGKLQTMSSLFTDAEATFTSVITTFKNTPAAAAATYEMGMLALRTRNYSGAIEQFKKVSSNESADDSLQASALINIGETYAAQHDYGNAQKVYERLIARFPKSSLVTNAILSAGKAALLSNNPTVALQYARKFIALPSPSNKYDAYVLAAHSAVSANVFNEAITFYTILSNEYADDRRTPALMIEFAHLYELKLRDCRKAVNIYDQIVQQYPQSRFIVEALIGTAECQRTLGDIESALKTYTDLQTRYPAHDQFELVQKNIEFLQHHFLKNRDAGIQKLARLMGEVLTQQSKADLSFNLGEIYFNDLKDYEAAANQFGLTLDKGLDETKHENAQYFRARALDLYSEIDSNAAEQAIMLYAGFLKDYPTSSRSDDAAYQRYLLLKGKRNSSERILLAKDFLREHPNSMHREPVLLDLGESAAASGDTASAVNAFNTFVVQFPQSVLLNKTLLEQGNLFLHSHQTDSAAERWQRIVNRTFIDPSTVAAASNLANLEWRQKHYPEAIALWERLSSEFFYTSAADVARSMLPEGYITNSQYDEAIAALNTAREQGSFDLSFHFATAHEKKGDRQQATHYYHEYLLHNPKGPHAGKAFYALGGLARSQGKTDLASTYFKQAAALAGTTSATTDIADLLFQTEQYAEAARQYTLLAQSTDTLETKKLYFSRAIVATLRMDKLVEGQKLIGEFIKTFGEDNTLASEFQYEIGNYYYRKQDYVNARKTFEKLSNDGEKTRFGPWGHYYLGKIAEVNNKLEDAAKKYEDILHKYLLSDVIPRVLLSLGNMHFNAERYETAIKFYQQISDAPGRAGDILPYAMNNLIEAYESTKLYDAALKTTRDYIERYPNDENILDKKIKLGTLYTKIGYYDQAVLHFQNLIAEAGNLLEAEIRYNIGEAYYNKGNYSQAILEFLKVPYLVAKQGKVNWTATSFYMAGQAYEKMSKFDEAIGMYQQVIDRSGIDATFKAAARKEIDRVKTIMRKGSK